MNDGKYEKHRESHTPLSDNNESEKGREFKTSLASFPSCQTNDNLQSLNRFKKNLQSAIAVDIMQISEHFKLLRYKTDKS